MPKIVDHEKQKQLLAKATWKVIQNEGIEGASVRKIADEAGISPGSMRYYFSTQSELLYFSMKLVAEKIRNRITNIPFTGNPFQDALLLLSELVPIDEEKRAEMEVWLVFNIKALTDSSLQELSRNLYIETKEGLSNIIETLMNQENAAPSLDKETEVQILYSLIDGLTFQGIMFPDLVTPQRIEQTLMSHLHSLCTNE